jgi:hypothetical protein
MILPRPDYDPNILICSGLDNEDLNSVTVMIKDYLNLFKPCYRRSEQKNQVDTFITGLLSDLERKSIEPVTKLQLSFKWIVCDSAFGVDRVFLEA